MQDRFPYQKAAEQCIRQSSPPYPAQASHTKEGELLLARFGFYCYQKAHAMPDGVALFALDASREEFISLLKARGIHD